MALEDDWSLMTVWEKANRTENDDGGFQGAVA